MVEKVENLIHRVPMITWLLMFSALLLILFAASDAVKEMIRFWEDRPEYSHGYLIPVISLFLVWQRSDILRHIKFTGSWSALILILVGFSLILIGSMTTVAAIGQYGVFFSILGVVASYMGWNGFKIVLVPLLFLIFALPLPGFFLNNLSAKLQLISSEIGVAVIRAFDISVYLEGNVIDLGMYKLQVVEACSGLRYLFPLMSLAFMMAYFFQAALWKRAIVFLSSIPITVLMNSFRIGMIGVLVEYFGIEQAEGFLHDFEGWAVFMACMAVLFLEMWLFAKFSSEKKPLREVFGIDFPDDAPEDIPKVNRAIPGSLIAGVAITGIFAVLATQIQARDESIPARKSFSAFPEVLENWSGRQDSLESIYLDVLKLDDYIIIDYKNSDNRAVVNFYAAYYASQRAGGSAHSPRSCIPGGGWQIKSHKVISLDDVTENQESFSVNRLVIKKGKYSQLVYYWFPQRGRNITNEYLVKWFLFWDTLRLNRTDGALVRLTVTVGPNQSIGQADEQLKGFMQILLPQLDPYLPE